MRRLGPALGQLSPWTRLVAICAVLIAGAGAMLLVWWVSSGTTRESLYTVRGSLDGIRLDLDSVDLQITGGGERPSVVVRRIDHLAFGRRPEVHRTVDGRILHIRTRCPNVVPSSCSSRYQLVVPDNVPVTVTTTDGEVRFRRFHGSASIQATTGDIDISSFCGFSLQATTEDGAIDAIAACAPESMTLRSRSGAVHAVVPRGRYRIDASSDTGSSHLRGLTSINDAPFQIQALSNSGNVLVEAKR